MVLKLGQVTSAAALDRALGCFWSAEREAELLIVQMDVRLHAHHLTLCRYNMSRLEAEYFAQGPHQGGGGGAESVAPTAKKMMKGQMIIFHARRGEPYNLSSSFLSGWEHRAVDSLDGSLLDFRVMAAAGKKRLHERGGDGSGGGGRRRRRLGEQEHAAPQRRARGGGESLAEDGREAASEVFEEADVEAVVGNMETEAQVEVVEVRTPPPWLSISGVMRAELPWSVRAIKYPINKSDVVPYIQRVVGTLRSEHIESATTASSNEVGEGGGSLLGDLRTCVESRLRVTHGSGNWFQQLACNARPSSKTAR